jgi:hypothetical protein
MLNPGDKVKIYTDPITKKRIEGEAIIKSIIRLTGWCDCDDYPLWICNVKFDGDTHPYRRDVSSAPECLIKPFQYGEKKT